MEEKNALIGGPLAGYIADVDFPEDCNLHVTFLKIDHKDGAGSNTIPLRGTYIRDKDNSRLLRWHEYP